MESNGAIRSPDFTVLFSLILQQIRRRWIKQPLSIWIEKENSYINVKDRFLGAAALMLRFSFKQL